MYEAEDAYWWFVSRRRLARRLLARIARPAGPLLDLGCGTGAATAFFGAAFPEHPVLGADFSPEALRFAAGRGLDRLARADAEALPYASGSFAAVVCLDLLEHVRDDRAAAAEAFRCLAPGGAFVVNVPAFRWLWGAHDVALMHHRRYSRREVRALLEGAGFRVERLSYTMFLLFPFVLAQRAGSRLVRRPGAKLPRVPTWFNRVLVRTLDLEAGMLVRTNLPWGSSVTAVARKPTRH